MKKFLMGLLIFLGIFAIIMWLSAIWLGGKLVDFGKETIPKMQELVEKAPELEGELNEFFEGLEQEYLEEGTDIPSDDNEERGEDESEATEDDPIEQVAGANSRGDRIYQDGNTNVWIEYKSGRTLQLTENAGTTRGCGDTILYYKDPVLSEDSQYAILPLYCEGDPTEVYIKEVATFKSAKIADGESGTFVEEAGQERVQVAGNTYPNPFTDLCAQKPVIQESGMEVYPIAAEYAQLEHLGQLFTASECGNNRMEELYGVRDGVYTKGIRLTLKANPTEDLMEAFATLEFTCGDETEAQTCREWRQASNLPAVDVLKLKTFADQFADDDCINCG